MCLFIRKSLQDYNLAFHTTYVMCVYTRIAHEERDIQFKVDSER